MMSADDRNMNAQDDLPPPMPRPQPETLLYRALKLRCPRCGKGKLFARWFLMHKRCTECNLWIDRQAGYYLGSTYVNYGLTALIVTVVFMVGQLVFHIPDNRLLWPLAIFCLVFPLLLFRHARAIWLAMDCLFDSSVLSGDDETGQ